MIRIIVTGGRDYEDRDHVFDTLDQLARRFGGIELVIHGATPTRRGADWHADGWARRRGVPHLRFPVDQRVDGPWPRAGNARNARMLMRARELGRVDAVVAFPGGSGTQDMVDRAVAAGVDVWQFGRRVMA